MPNYTIDDIISLRESGTYDRNVPLKYYNISLDELSNMRFAGIMDLGVEKPGVDVVVTKVNPPQAQSPTVNYNENHMPVQVSNAVPITPTMPNLVPEMVIPGYNDNTTTIQDVPGAVSGMSSVGMISGVSGGGNDGAVIGGLLKYAKYGAVFVGVVMVLNLLKGGRKHG